MKRLIRIVLCAHILLTGMCLHAHAFEPGEDCTTAIEMGKDYSAFANQGQTVWYTAWTFDLPITVTFEPLSGETAPPPIVEMDFSCTSGYYEDSILCSYFCKTGGGVQIDLPHKPKLDSKKLDDGTFVYYLSLGKQYRDFLLKVGISYNVQVFVKVTYQSSGTISMAPDDLFSNCVDGAKFMHIGDTVRVAAMDEKRHVIVPYVQWQEDTIVYRWSGTTPCTISVANTCDFKPLDNLDENMIQFSPNIAPGDSLKVPADHIYKWVHNPEFKNEAGMYFAKFYSAEPGVIKVVRAPQAPPRGDATILRFDRTYPLNANETALFAITKTWCDDTLNTQFTTPTEHVFRMQIASDPDFSEEHLIKTYQFDRGINGHWKGILGTDMVQFWKKATDQYLYIRFICTEATTVTPSKWFRSDCVKNTKNYITPGNPDTTFTVKTNNNGGNYIFNYAQWKGGDMTLKLSKKNTCQVFIAYSCGITTSTTAANLLKYRNFTASRDTILIKASEIDSWADKIDKEGYFYMRVQHNLQGTTKLTVSTTAPPDADPIYPASTIAVVCEGTDVTVHVSEPQTIIIYDGDSVEVDRWDAEPGVAHTITLPSGKYILAGAEEKIEINL